jgi:hypothetical protein
MTKLPEPEGRICFDGGDWEEDFVSSQDAYSEDQMLQFRRDALEDAALVCDALAQKASSSIAKSAFNVSANEIRTLKEQIK